MTAHGDDGVRVAELLCDWLEAEFGDPVEMVGSPTSIEGGLDSWIHRVRFSGAALPAEWRQPLIARVKRRADAVAMAHREADIQEWAARVGYPCPQILAVFDPGELLDLPVQIMDFVPGVTLLRATTTAPWRAPAVVGRLAELQARLHDLDPEGFPIGEAPEDLAERRLSLVRSTVDVTDDVALTRGLERVEALLPRLRAAPAVVCHGDFHPLNVLVDDDDSWVLDWTDAGLGDRHGDVSRTMLLFRLASVVADGRVQRRALAVAGPWMARRHQRAYELHAPLDPARLALWDPVHLLHGWSQVIGLHHGQFTDAGSDSRTSTVPIALGEQLRSRFETAIGLVE